MLKRLLTKSEGTFTLFEYVFIRSLVYFGVSLVILIMKKQNLGVPKELRGFLSFSAVIGFLVFTGCCVGMSTLPVSWFVLILQTNSFFTAMLTSFWLHLPVELLDIVAMLGSYSGIIILTVSSS